MVASKSNRAKKKNEHTALVNSICDFLLAQGYFVWQAKSIGTFNQKTNQFQKVHYTHGRIKGISDILGVAFDGRIIAIECKTGEARLSKEQRIFIGNLVVKGGIGFMAKSIEDVIKNFRSHRLPVVMFPHGLSQKSESHEPLMI